MIRVKKQKIIDAIRKSRPIVWGPENQWCDYGLVILNDGRVLVNDNNWMPNFNTTISMNDGDTLEQAISDLLEMVSESDHYEIID